MIIVNGKGTMNIWGKIIHCNGETIEIKNGEILVDGKPFQGYDKAKVLKVEITGNVESVSSEDADVIVHGKVGTINSKNGNVTCGDVDGNVDSKNGNIVCGSIKGDCTTKNGNIMRQ